MPVSFEGLDYERYLFKPVDNCEGGGLWADVYLPDTPPKNGHTGWPVGIAIHGGGFCFGDTNHIFCGHFEYLLQHGVAVVSVEYRLAPHVRQPEQREDWLDAYKWVTSPSGLSKALGDKGKIDGARSFVFGGSAGGVATYSLTIDLIRQKLPLPRALYVCYPIVDFNAISSVLRPPVPFSKYDSIVATLSPEEQKKLKQLWDGPIGTRYSHRGEYDRPQPTPRRVWFEAAAKHGFLLTHYLNEDGLPFSDEKNLLPNFSSDFPPTVHIKALADHMLPPEQTQMGHDRLVELGVESKLLEARGMLHGDIEETQGTLLRWGRDIASVWWDEVYKPALDFCIEKCA